MSNKFTFTINCIAAGNQMVPVQICVGDPSPGVHPIHHQMMYLGSKGIQVPEYLKNVLSVAQERAESSRTSVVENFVYIFDEFRLGQAMQAQSEGKEFKIFQTIEELSKSR